MSNGDVIWQSKNSFYKSIPWVSVWPDWTIYWTLGNFSQPLATFTLPKSPTFLRNFCKGVKIFNFSSEIIFGQLLQTFGDFFTGHTDGEINKEREREGEGKVFPRIFMTKHTVANDRCLRQ